MKIEEYGYWQGRPTHGRVRAVNVKVDSLIFDGHTVLLCGTGRDGGAEKERKSAYA